MYAICVYPYVAITTTSPRKRYCGDYYNSYTSYTGYYYTSYSYYYTPNDDCITTPSTYI